MHGKFPAVTMALLFLLVETKLTVQLVISTA
ncbi:hypothetical protein [Thalassotalea fonticola]